jgi:DNA-3-methyladenine glycosylase II
VLDEISLASGLRVVCERDADLAAILRRLGPPPVWAREEGFATLVHIILEQQVSLASARAAFGRLLAVVSPLTPEGFLRLDVEALKSVGFSRQKMIYARHLAESIVEGRLDLQSLAGLEDAEVKSALTKVKGIGDWTADIYLLMALRRPDAWPRGDLALAVAWQRLKGLIVRPTPQELEDLAGRWRPWRAVAARLLWHYYLSRER